MVAGISQNFDDLTVLDAAGRARVLALSADAMCALLAESRFVQHQHRLGIIQVSMTQPRRSPRTTWRPDEPAPENPVSHPGCYCLQIRPIGSRFCVRWFQASPAY
jgi:hypothetical protein